MANSREILKKMGIETNHFVLKNTPQTELKGGYVTKKIKDIPTKKLPSNDFPITRKNIPFAFGKAERTNPPLILNSGNYDFKEQKTKLTRGGPLDGRSDVHKESSWDNDQSF